MAHRKMISLPWIFLLLAATPFLLSFPLFPGYSSTIALKSLVSKSEKIIAFAFLMLFIASYYHEKSGGIFNYRNVGASEDHYNFFEIFLPALPLIIYSLLFTQNAFERLLLLDLDFTGISSALSNTVHGYGFLDTAFFETGNGKSFLGHHFSPGLSLFLPLYFVSDYIIAPISKFFYAKTYSPETHLSYGLFLVLVLFFGLLFWARFIQSELNNKKAALFVFFALIISFPILRIFLSFHFELLVLPISALFFIALKSDNKKLLWVSLILWVGVKEDIAIYLFLFGCYLATQKEHKDTAGKIIVFSLLYFLLANQFLKPHLAGGEDPSWNFWKTISFNNIKLEPSFDMLLAFAFIPLLRPALFLIVILPIFLLHTLSDQPWHASYYGHYGYTVLPFLMFGFVEGNAKIHHLLGGARKFSPYFAALTIALIAYSAGGEKETPLSFQPPDSNFREVKKMLAEIPEGACLQTQPYFSALAPLHARIFPISIPLKNPYKNDFPNMLEPNPGENFNIPGYCNDYYLLLDESPKIQYFSRIDYTRYTKLAEVYLSRIKETKNLKLFGLKKEAGARGKQLQ